MPLLLSFVSTLPPREIRKLLKKLLPEFRLLPSASPEALVKLSETKEAENDIL